MSTPLCACTMGDPSGIGPEVILKAFFTQRVRKTARVIVIGCAEPFERDRERLGLDFDIRRIDTPSAATDQIAVLNIMEPEMSFAVPLDYGIVDERCGKAAGLAIEKAASLAISGAVDAIVTAPINKESLNLAGYKYPGHTEFLKHLSGAPFIGMMLTLGAFRVIHVATHVAIRDVPKLIKKDRIIEVASLMRDALVLLGIDKPKIAVSGLNPHAGEAGMFGSEEIEEIIPAVEELRSRGYDFAGPVSPDIVFARAYCGEFDGVVAMYHDQGHIALKLAGFTFSTTGREVGGVNTTLGMPIIRTSVDHGTAFDIAGQGIASPTSMIEAIEMAAALARGKVMFR